MVATATRKKIEMYNFNEVASALDVSYTTIASWISKLNIEAVNRPNPRGGHPLRFVTGAQLNQLIDYKSVRDAELAAANNGVAIPAPQAPVAVAKPATPTRPSRAVTQGRLPVTVYIGSDTDPIRMTGSIKEPNFGALVALFREG